MNKHEEHVTADLALVDFALVGCPIENAGEFEAGGPLRLGRA